MALGGLPHAPFRTISSHRRRAVRTKLPLAFTAVFLLGAAPAPAAAATFHGASFRLDTGLTPAFSRTTPDYVTHCTRGQVKVMANAPEGVMLRIDTAATVSGNVTRAVQLNEGQRFEVRMKAGREATAFTVRCLPDTFPKLKVTGTLPGSTPFIAVSGPGLGAIFPYAIIADARGVPVWWKLTGGSAPFDIKVIGSGAGARVAWWQGQQANGVGVGAYRVSSLAGRIEKTVGTVGLPTDLHDMIPSSRGTWYAASYARRDNVDLTPFGGPADGSVWDTVIQEVTASGKLLWSWNSKDHITLAETGRWWSQWSAELSAEKPPVFDVTHFNSIEDDHRGGLIISLRHLDAMIRIRRSDGSIDWKLGGTPTDRSLKIVGDDANAGAHFGGQHDARLLHDGTLTAYDNRTDLASSVPRATRWKLDTVKRTATLVEQVTDPAIASASCCGNARRLDDGSWLIDWGPTNLIRSYDPRRRMRFSFSFDEPYTFSYRAFPIAAGQLTRSQLVAGMDAMNPR